MRKLFKITAILIAVLLGLAVMLLGVLHLLPDEELLPGAQVWLEREPPDFPPEENLYYYLWGLEAPRDYSVFAFGRERAERLRMLNETGYRWGERVSENGTVSVEAMLAEFETMLLPDGVDAAALLDGPARESVCQPNRESCLQFYRDADMSPLHEGDNAILLARYRAVLEVPHYQSMDTIRYNGPSVPTHVLGKLQRLYLATVLGQFMSGDTSSALEALAADLRFYRMLLAEADYLVPKMFAIAMVAADLHLYSQFIDSGIATDEVIAAIAAIPPLSEAEYAMEEVMAGELRFSANLFKQLQYENGMDNESVWLKVAWRLLPYRPNELINLRYRILHAFVASSHLPPGPFDTAMDEALDAIEPKVGLMTLISNPFLALPWMYADANYKYHDRLHDLDALITMLRLKSDIAAQGIAEEDYDAFLAAAGDAATVYGEERVPIQWDWEGGGFFFVPPLYPDDHSDQLTVLPTYWVVD